VNGAYLRPARSTDAGAVGAILSEFTDVTPWLPRVHTRAEDLRFAGQMIDRGWVMVAEQADQVRAFIAREGAAIQSLYVAQSARRLGFGSALLRAAQNGRHSLTLWTFQANAAARAFYVAHGFAPVEHTDGHGNDVGLPDIRMTWQRETA
jgi:GNAT superfamily N-acetyltransferase